MRSPNEIDDEADYRQLFCSAPRLWPWGL